jgi:tetratricopeptide (TPR) repeat protein
VQNPDFRRADVEQQLYELFLYLADQQIAQANGDINLLREAQGYLTQALALRPTDKALLEKHRLASDFVAGFEALARQDWAAAVVFWESIQNTQPDYLDGIVEDYLAQAYPEAARQLVAEAKGSVPRLRRAIHYLDQALIWQPNSQEFAEQRRLAAEYVAGAEAMAQGQWDEAISHWGPLYADHPDYQTGALKTNLSQACSHASPASKSLCPP